MNPLTFIDEWIVKITALSGPTLLIVTLWMAGYFFKLVPVFPNRLIPAATLGIALTMTPFLVMWPSPGDAPPGLRWPNITAWIQTVDRAVLLWALAWLTHATALKKLIDDKVNGALNPELRKETQKYKEITPEQETTVNVEKTVKEKKEP